MTWQEWVASAQIILIMPTLYLVSRAVDWWFER